MEDLATVTTFSDVPEAELAGERLEEIRAFVMSAQTTGVMPFLTASSGGVRAQVNQEDLAKAKRFWDRKCQRVTEGAIEEKP